MRMVLQQQQMKLVFNKVGIKKNWHSNKNNYHSCNYKLKIFIFWSLAKSKMITNISIDYQIL